MRISFLIFFLVFNSVSYACSELRSGIGDHEITNRMLDMCLAKAGAYPLKDAYKACLASVVRDANGCFVSISAGVRWQDCEPAKQSCLLDLPNKGYPSYIGCVLLDTPLYFNKPLGSKTYAYAYLSNLSPVEWANSCDWVDPVVLLASDYFGDLYIGNDIVMLTLWVFFGAMVAGLFALGVGFGRG